MARLTPALMARLRERARRDVLAEARRYRGRRNPERSTAALKAAMERAEKKANDIWREGYSLGPDPGNVKYWAWKRRHAAAQKAADRAAGKYGGARMREVLGRTTGNPRRGPKRSTRTGRFIRG